MTAVETEQVTRIECVECHHTLRLRLQDGGWHHSGPSGRTCTCRCESVTDISTLSYRVLPSSGARRGVRERSAALDDPAAASTVAATVPEPSSAGPAFPATVGGSSTPQGQSQLLPFSNSEMQTWKRCKRKWFLGWYRGLRFHTEERVGARALGTRVHLALAQQHTGYPLAVLNQQLTEDLEAAGGDPETEKKLLSQHELAYAMVEGYIEWVAENGMDEGYTIVSHEEAISVPLPEIGVELRGRLDVRLEREVDHVRLVRDYKTVGDLVQPTRMLQLDEQMLFYMLLERLDIKLRGGAEGEYVAGALYAMLRKVKRTAAAKPPFYAQIEVRHNDQELRNFWTHVVSTVLDVIAAHRRLDAGASHHEVCPPSPQPTCTWSCDYFAICPMFDDGSRVEDLLTEYYRVGDPYDRYDDLKGVVHE